jgi:uncharacterized phage-associated protein
MPSTIRRIRFDFNVEKFADSVAYLAGEVSDLTTLKTVKLLYLADRDHLLRHGRPILGDWYACMEHGPVPARAYDLLKEVRAPEPSFRLNGIDKVLQRIKVESDRRYPHFKRRDDSPLDALSASDIESLQRVVLEHGTKEPYALVALTHEHSAWKKSDAAGDHTIDYRWFFDDDDSAADLRHLMEEEQENRDFIAEFSTPKS